ncbi:MAG: N-acetylmuramoyl-L-alanine amidase [Oenococcus sp.]|uniref:peptidoglycan recognition protein family protein n=1 Tax=Oenococcus TaxID=46254 RepID=UPI0021E84F1F|nr:N-acetylmuramoyl-L-alanine amidase [Oenococcus kitaharae]MCV3296280.1 N-acetylmuramoyl-L-alanine amidase [Oenococcus kitaharae]
MKLSKFLFSASLLSGIWLFNESAQADLSSNLVIQHIQEGIARKSWQPVQEENFLNRSGMLPRNNYRNGQGRPEGIVIHETANPTSTIYNEISYMYGHWQSAFVHEFVDANHLVGVANTDYLCWGAGTIANQRFIQVEQLEVHSKDDFAREQLNLAKFTADQLSYYRLGTGRRRATIWSHDDVSRVLGGTNHSDPVSYWNNSASNWFSGSYNMDDFIWLVNQIKSATLMRGYGLPSIIKRDTQTCWLKFGRNTEIFDRSVAGKVIGNSTTLSAKNVTVKEIDTLSNGQVLALVSQNNNILGWTDLTALIKI